MNQALSVVEVAKALNLGVPTVRRMIARRELPHVRLGRRVTLLTEDIAKYVAARRVPAAGEPVSTRSGEDGGGISRPRSRQPQT